MADIDIDKIAKGLGAERRGKVRIRVEYDDGSPIGRDKGRSELCTAKGRPMGMYVMYVILPDGTERPLNIGYMKVGEMGGLEELLNDLCR